MPLTRREFIWSAASVAAAWPLRLDAQRPDATGPDVFRHGVASGDPGTDRAILWTRATPRDEGATSPVDVRWEVATDPAFRQVVRRGRVSTSPARDYTVKVDVDGLVPGRHYYYAFDALGQRSPVGRTKTLPAGTVSRVRLGLVCCANYPAGFFNVYRRLAAREDLDAVLHVGDYIYEFANRTYGDGAPLQRVPEPQRETVTLADYRIRYATYRLDPDLQEVHRQHPFIAVWDDHESANDAWSGGAGNHNPDRGEGDWATRLAAAYQAYLEWMPIREAPDSGVRLYRSFQFGTLMDLVMLDTRGLRDRQVAPTDVDGLVNPSRSILGAAQEAWLFEQLGTSQRGGRGWRFIGQQVLFSRLTPPGARVILSDMWDGYQAARSRILDYVSAERISDLVVLSGDLHSSWALDIARNPWGGYLGGAGEGSLGVECVAPAVSSPPLFTDESVRQRAPQLRALLPTLKYLEGDSRGYVLLDVTPAAVRADWQFVPDVRVRSDAETRGASFVCERGSARLATA